MHREGGFREGGEKASCIKNVVCTRRQNTSKVAGSTLYTKIYNNRVQFAMYSTCYSVYCVLNPLAVYTKPTTYYFVIF